MQESDDLALLVAAAHAAGEIARRHFGDGPKSWEKAAGQGPVSEADLEIDDMLRTHLLAARPDYGWLSEESVDDPARLNCPRLFIVDPIDGTRAFLEGQTGFSHALAIVEHGKPIAAVVHLPMMGLTYAASRGQGAYLGEQRLRVTGCTTPSGARILATRPQMTAEYWPGGVPAIDRHFRPSLAWRLALVAEGKFDGMVNLRPTWHWDIAAGVLLIEEAGGVVTTGTGDAVLFNTPKPASDGVIAAGNALHYGLLHHRLGA